MYEQTLADVAKAWRNGEFEKQGGADGRRTFDVYGLNGGTSIIKAGSAVRITRFSANVSYDKAYKKLINGDLTVTVRFTGDHAYTLEPIPPGRYGRIGGVIFAIVTYSDTSHTYCDEEFNSVASDGAYKILAYVGRKSSKSICVLKRIGGTGGGGGTATYTDVVDSVTPTTGSVVGSIATTTANVLSASDPVVTSASLATGVSGGVQVPTAIDASNGVLTITWESIGVTTTTGSAQGVSVVASVTPTSTNVVASIATTTTSVVEDVS